MIATCPGSTLLSFLLLCVVGSPLFFGGENIIITQYYRGNQLCYVPPYRPTRVGLLDWTCVVQIVEELGVVPVVAVLCAAKCFIDGWNARTLRSDQKEGSLWERSRIENGPSNRKRLAQPLVYTVNCEQIVPAQRERSIDLMENKIPDG